MFVIGLCRELVGAAIALSPFLPWKRLPGSGALRVRRVGSCRRGSLSFWGCYGGGSVQLLPQVGSIGRSVERGSAGKVEHLFAVAQPVQLSLHLEVFDASVHSANTDIGYQSFMEWHLLFASVKPFSWVFVSQTLERRKSLCRDDRPQYKAATSGQEAYVNKQYKDVELSKSRRFKEQALAQDRGKLIPICQRHFVFFVHSTPVFIGSVNHYGKCCPH